MRYLFTIISFFVFNVVFNQIDTTKLFALNPNDEIDKILKAECDKIENIFSTYPKIRKTEIYSTQFSNKFGIIINKPNLIKYFNDNKKIDTVFFIRLLLSHELMHSRWMFPLGDYVEAYLKKATKEQLLLDEVISDLAAGYISGYFNGKESYKLFNEVKDLERKDSTENLDSNFLLNFFNQSYILSLNENEILAKNLFFSLGDNQSHFSKYPNSLQRNAAFQIGSKIGMIVKMRQMLINKTREISTSEKENIENYISMSEYNFLFYNKDFIKYPHYHFLEHWVYWYAKRISNLPSKLNRYINYEIIKVSESSNKEWAHYKSKITNLNTKDSINFVYSLIAVSKDKNNFSNFYFGEVLEISNSACKLAPLQSKIVIDSLNNYDNSEVDNYKVSVIFPGEFNSLYFTTYLIDDFVEHFNIYNSKYFLNENKITINNYSKINQPIEDFLLDIAEMLQEIKIMEIDEFQSNINLKLWGSKEFEQNIILFGRPFKLVNQQINKNSIFKTKLIQFQNYNTAKKCIEKIYNHINKKYKVSSSQNVIEGENIVAYDKNNIKLFDFTLMEKDDNNNYAIEFKLYKNN